MEVRYAIPPISLTANIKTVELSIAEIKAMSDADLLTALRGEYQPGSIVPLPHNHIYIYR